jgi:ACR3 family arsenite transporter
MKKQASEGISFFQHYLSVWVALCTVVGMLLGHLLPGIAPFLNRFEYYRVSIPMAILIWIMIYPMMMKVDFKAFRTSEKSKGTLCNMDYQLAGQAVYDVRNCVAVFLCDF